MFERFDGNLWKWLLENVIGKLLPSGGEIGQVPVRTEDGVSWQEVQGGVEKEYVDIEIANAISESKDYADNIGAQTLNLSKQYTDEQIENVKKNFTPSAGNFSIEMNAEIAQTGNFEEVNENA